MRYSKRYIAFTIILAIAFVSKFYIFGQSDSTVDKFRGAEIKEEVWNPLIADDVNGGRITVVIDNKEYTNEEMPFYMNEDRNIMIPIELIRDAFNASSHVYLNTALLVEKHSVSATMTINETLATVGEDNVEIESPFIKKKGQYYVSINDLSKLLGYSCSFDIENKTITVKDDNEEASIVPTSYDLRKKGRVAGIKNQGSYGTCWAFAAISSLESALLPERTASLSVDNMCMNNSFNVTRDTGGVYTMGMAYLAAWQGPIYEEDDPYDDKVNTKAKPVMHVQEMQIIDGKDYMGIKEAVFKYGGVQTSLYASLSRIQEYSQYYNREKNAYCYMGTEKPNHDVVIIGWDDNYPAKNFNVELEGDGAFICQNSWGEDFGDNGIFYVSYYDTNIGTHNVVYTGIEPVDNYDNIYQSDLCGWVGKIGYKQEDIYGANVFTAKGNENLSAAAFYATAADTKYEVYIVKDFKDEKSFVNRKRVASGTLKNAGYYTIDFDKDVYVSKGEKYAVIVYLKTPGAMSPMAIENRASESYYDNVNLEDGEGYISKNGKTFKNVKTEEDCNLCIKAFSKNE